MLFIESIKAAAEEGGGVEVGIGCGSSGEGVVGGVVGGVGGGLSAEGGIEDGGSSAGVSTVARDVFCFRRFNASAPRGLELHSEIPSERRPFL